MVPNNHRLYDLWKRANTAIVDSGTVTIQVVRIWAYIGCVDDNIYCRNWVSGVIPEQQRNLTTITLNGESGIAY